MKMKGLYIVSEPACLHPNTGAGRHIEVGLRGLSRKFDMQLMLFCEPLENASTADRPVRVPAKRSGVFRLVKWLYILAYNHKNFFKHFKAVKRASPAFVYERANYLNYNGLIISRLLKIPHMYEVNGILALDHAPYYPRLCNRIALYLEKMLLRKTFGFYVGGINKELNVPEANAVIIQNGADQEFVEHFAKKKNVSKEVLDVVFIGHGMEHHRLDLLAEALRLLSSPQFFRLHLIGTRLESVTDRLPSGIDVKLYGSLSHEQIKEVVYPLHVAIIPYTRDYFSHVKLFMYGAAKLAVIIPRSRNYNSLFTTEEVMFIENGNSRELADKLTFFHENREEVTRYSEMLYKKVSNCFTWEKIYEKIGADVMHRLTHGKIA